jgi:bifunctional enzyme CysN/CysC
MKIDNKEQMNIVIVGHVDHGKSTIIGRMLADTHSLPEGKLEQIKETCRLNSKPFEYAFLLDALKDEQSQGITIDAARVFFQTERRHYIIIDAPGHIEFLKNMITGASRAEAALLVIDAKEGVRENSRRHGYMLSMLGIKQVAVAVNKMDLVDYNRQVFDDIVSEYKDFLKKIDIEAKLFIPVSGREGDNIVGISGRTPWYNGKTVVEILDQFSKEPAPVEKPFRMPVQDVYKFTQQNDDRRIIAGTIDSGVIKVGDEVVFYPSGKKSTVASIEAFNKPPQMQASAGEASGFTLSEQIYVSRGEMAAKAGEMAPKVSTRFKVSLFWLGSEPLQPKKEYILKIGTAKVSMRVEEILGVIDASNLDNRKKNSIERHDVAECIIRVSKAIAFDLAEDFAISSRFVIVDDYEIRGGGIIREEINDKQAWVRDKVLMRNYKWESSRIPVEKRAEKYNQKSTLLLISGEKDSGKKSLAKALEKQLFNEGKAVYFIGIGNILYGVDADIKDSKNERNKRAEHIRRLGEVAYLMLDAGMILIVTAVELTQDDLELLKTIVNPDKIEVIWRGDNKTTDIMTDLHLPANAAVDESLEKIKLMLQDKGIIFKPW